MSEKIEITTVGEDGREFLMMCDTDSLDIRSLYAGRKESIDIGSIVEAVKSSLGYLKNPITKCQHCGQYGAAFCACVKCGAPIDPNEDTK